MAQIRSRRQSGAEKIVASFRRLNSYDRPCVDYPLPYVDLDSLGYLPSLVSNSLYAAAVDPKAICLRRRSSQKKILYAQR